MLGELDVERQMLCSARRRPTVWPLALAVPAARNCIIEGRE
jgi:hypothetical protein